MIPALKDGEFYLDNQPLPLLSGEVHYWRLVPHLWKAALQRVSEMGIKIVASYVCWDFHEENPGSFDFSGQTGARRNLIGFLDLVTEMGFWIILQPETYIYSEWRNNAIPDDAAQHHRPSEMFKTRSRTDMQAVVQAAHPYLAQSGGRIILLQVDNEIDPWPSMYTESLDLGDQPGPFHEFLQSLYPSFDKLNDGWQTAFRSFAEVHASCVLTPNPLSADYCCYQDIIRFQHWHTNKATEWSAHTFRELGVDIPIYLNAYNGFRTQNWMMEENTADLCGMDIYPTNEFRHRPYERQRFIESTCAAASLSKYSYIAEFGSGIWHNWHYDVQLLDPNHYRLACSSALLGGIKGWNWYMLVNRDNWYQSPIHEWGRTRPELFDVFSRIVRVFNQINPATLTHLTDLAVTFDPLQRATTGPEPVIFSALYAADLDYSFYDLENDSCEKPLLFFANDHWLSFEKQARLLKYVRKGGHLIFFQTVLLMDDVRNKLNLFDLTSPMGTLLFCDRVELSLFEHTFTIPTQSIQTFGQIEGSPMLAKRLLPAWITAEELLLQFDLETGECYTVGYTRGMGKSQITHLGLPPGMPLLTKIVEASGYIAPWTENSCGCSTAVYQRSDELFLMAANNGESPIDLSVNPGKLPIYSRGDILVEDLFSGTSRKITADQKWDILLPVKDGTVLRI